MKRDMKSLKDELEDLDKCVDRETVVDLIQEIVPLLIREKSLIKNNSSSYSSDYSEDSDLAERIVKINGWVPKGLYQVREKRLSLISNERRRD